MQWTYDEGKSTHLPLLHFIEEWKEENQALTLKSF
jgi:hypothetical protein